MFSLGTQVIYYIASKWTCSRSLNRLSNVYRLPLKPKAYCTIISWQTWKKKDKITDVKYD